MKIPEYIETLNDGPIARMVILCCVLLTGYIAAKMVSRWLAQALAGKLNSHQSMIAKKISFHSIMVLTILTGLHGAGINLSVLVGAAGVVSVAIGLASQTTMSSLISGLFILLERPFMVGDTIRLGSTTGEVVTMGVFSTTLKNSDSMMVRIPNDMLMKAEITNATRYPLRRLEVQFSVAYASDMAQVRTLIRQAILELPITRENPAPAILFKSFGEAAIQLAVDFWVDKNAVTEASYLAAETIKKVLEAASIKRTDK
jgi:small-conductance mechanosensitive channel